MLDSTLIIFVLLPAAISDLAYYKVSNTIVLNGLILSVILRVVFGGMGNFFPWLIGGFVPFLLCFLLYLIGAFGASDVKLFSIIGSFYGCKTGIVIMFLSFCFGAICSIIYLIRMKNTRQRWIDFDLYRFRLIFQKKSTLSHRKNREDVIPFAVCIFFGTMTAVLLRNCPLID